MGDGGAMGGRTAGRPRQGREMGSVHLIFLILMREIFYILQESYAGECTKKGEKKSFHLLCSEKGEINIQMIACWYKTYIRRFGEETKKTKGVTVDT